MEEKIIELEKEIAALKERNSRVEADKAWETSGFRIGSITVIIYLISVVVLYFTHNEHVLRNALVPPIGYWLSTQSLPIIKRWWVKKRV